MNTPRVCSTCGSEIPADAPGGLCPACSLRAAFDGGGSHDPAEALPPEELARRFPELEGFEPIGRGGMGAVYRARHRDLDRPVAVKILDPTLSERPAFAERFAREARTLASLDHPNIVKVYDSGSRENITYLVMEWVDGVSLRQIMEDGEVAPAEALAMVPRICEALQYAHDQGVVHRDIKPENILVDAKGTVKIADFGLAKLVRGDAARSLTRTDDRMGTPVYMAPEQIERPREVDHRADIFALGVVFYELLTGELPVGRFPPPSRRVRVDVRLDEVVLRTLEKEPDLRYQQASELRSDVESVAAGGGPVFASAEAALTGKPAPQGYEYRSEKMLFGLPLVHIAFSGSGKGARMRLASGIIAVGDIAIGGVAIGGFTFGGICFGGISVGLVSFAGIAVGLLAAMGGVPFGGFSVGGIAFGIVSFASISLGLLGAAGKHIISNGTLTDAALMRCLVAGWMILLTAFAAGAGGGIYAWLSAVRDRSPGRGPAGRTDLDDGSAS